jgi:hypothetical protein
MARKKSNAVISDESMEKAPSKATKSSKSTKASSTKKKNNSKSTPIKQDKQVQEVQQQPIPSTHIENTVQYIEGDAMSLDEFYDAIEKTQLVSQQPPSLKTKLKNLISYYDRETQTMANINIGTQYPLKDHDVLYAYLSTEENKVGLARILTDNFSKYITIHSYSTKYTPEVNVYIVYVSHMTPLGIRKLINHITYTVLDWCDAKYFQVKDINAFSKHMTEEIESPNRTHKHKCMLIKTRSFKLADGSLSNPGIPVTWTFQGSYIDPVNGTNNFIYTIDDAYTVDPQNPGLILENGMVIHKYTITINEIIGLLNDSNSDTLFLFQSDELNDFVRKESIAMFTDIGLKIIERLS